MIIKDNRSKKDYIYRVITIDFYITITTTNKYLPRVCHMNFLKMQLKLHT